MKNLFFIPFILNFLCLYGTPTSLFWTNDTTDILETGYLALEVDNYFSVVKTGKPRPISFLPPEIGLEYGLFTYKDISCEVGIDYFINLQDPVFFNGKVGMMEEGKLFENSPSWNIGIFGVGTRERKTNGNVVDFIVGKKLPNGGRLLLAAYNGSKVIGPTRAGVMIGYDHKLAPTKDSSGREYNKWIFVADYATGKNAIGGGGFAMTYFVNPDINITTGPVWFNDAHFNGQWKWALQIVINIPVMSSKHTIEEK